MSRVVACSTIIALVCAAAAGDYPAEILTDSPLGYFRLNETVASGDLVSSTTGAGTIYDHATGSPVAAGQWWSNWDTGGLAEAAGVLAGDGAVDFPFLRASARTAAVPSGYPFTMEAWFRQYSVDRNGAIVALGQTAGLSDTFAIILANGRLRVEVRNVYTVRSATGVSPVDDGNWHHVAAVFEAAAGGGTLARLYLDGETAQPEAGIEDAAVTFNGVVDNFTIGSMHYNSRVNTNQLADCVVDEVALYDHALSAERIIAHYAAGAPPAPKADAGVDQRARADQSNHPVTITLDGSGSTPDDSPIADYSWTAGGTVIATGKVTTAPFDVGTHTVILTVTDGEGDTDTDWCVVTIVDGTPVPPVADAGADQAVHDADADGSEMITLDGTASYSPDPDGSLVSAAWTDAAGAPVATGLNPTVTLARGVYQLTLTVTDNYGLTDTDTVGIAVGGEQLLNLPDDRPSFPVPADIVWPDTVGDPHICLWYGDTFAALSITIDDNNLPQQAWWMQMAQTYGFTPTWFIVVGGVNSGSNPGFNGTWPDYVSLVAAGGDVQTHTMSHHSDDDVRPDAEVHYEYGQSQALIDANIPGHPCLTLGYPYGNGKPDIARQYFIAARGVHGTPNKPTKINWMMTDSASGRIDPDYVHPILYGTSTIAWLNSTQWKRSWLCTHFHGVSDLVAEEARLAYVDSLRHLIWWGSFGEVARFGQERDSAAITVIENSAIRITFEITDRMNDLIFDHPLTIKLRLPDAWSGAAAATQAGAATGYSLISHGGYDYILVDAVPDRGLVEIVPASDQPGDIDGDGDVDLDDFVVLKQNFGTLGGAGRDQGDLDGDGDVDLDDFVILKQNFGA